jgi:hypothetical protein
MALRVVVLDMLKLRCVVESWNVPVQFPEPTMDSRITATDIPEVGLEVLHIADVEADNGCVKPDVSLCDRRPKVIRPGIRG